LPALNLQQGFMQNAQHTSHLCN